MTQLQNANGRGVTIEERPADNHANLLDQVVQATAARYSVRDVETMAKKASASRLYGMDEAQAFCLMMIAESEGLHPIQALKRYHIIQGRPAMRADAMQAEFQRQGGTVEWVKTTDTECEAIFRHPHQCPKGQPVSFTMADAKRAGLAGKDTWAKYPASMLRARVISMGIRMVLPGVVVGVYTPEEVSDFVSDDRGPAQPILERPPGPNIEHPPNNEPKAEVISEAKAWVKAAVQMANDKLRNLLLIEGKGDQFKPVVSHANQVVNAMITAWIGDGTLEESDILKPTGVRDPAKAGAAFQVGWQQDEAEVKADIWAFLDGKARAICKDLGIEWADDEPKLPESLAGTADDAFEEGRE